MKKKENIALRVKRMLAALAAAVLLLEAAPLSSVRRKRQGIGNFRRRAEKRDGQRKERTGFC